MDFLRFRERMREHIDDMIEQGQALFVAEVDGPTLWDAYLDSFPPGTNEIHKERRQHDCSACKSFVRQFGGVATIIDGEMVSIWDVDGVGDYQPVADAMSGLVKAHPISNVFVTNEGAFGTDKNHAETASGVHTWYHFRVELPKRLVSRGAVGEKRHQHRTAHDVFKRSLEELSRSAVTTVLDMIAEKCLYRGEEWRTALTQFLALLDEYEQLPTDKRPAFCWLKSVEIGGAVTRIRNHSIGVLLQDLTAGGDVLDAVKKYERIVAPTNYKRPKAIFTTQMVEQAQRKVEELGLLDALGRRHAHLRDITINNVLFADRDAQPHMGGAPSVFDVLKNEVPVPPRQFERAPRIGVDKFMAEMLPTAAHIEVLLEGRHQHNLVSLVAPQVPDSPTMFKWGNGFSWAYNGNIADSMRERVKMAGGNVEGVLRFSIQWNENGDNQNDFDAHCQEPNRNHIYYPNKARRHASSGMLDVDIIQPGRRVAVENITWTDLRRMPEGVYHLYVHNYSHRGGRSGFAAEIEYDGEIHAYEYRKELSHNENVTVAKVRFSRANGITFIEQLPSTMSSKDVWGLKTNQWQRVSALMYSPNHWNGQGVGNRHWFFMLVGCTNDERPNGFFNEYLREDLMPHRRVFEALGSKMRVAESDEQLSGLGFSSTKRNSVVAKIDGEKILRVVF